MLVGHVPIEISQLLNNFLNTGENNNSLQAEVTGKRKREIGLVVPAKYKATTDNKKFAEVLKKKLEEKRKIIKIDIETADTEIKKFPCVKKEEIEAK